VAFRTTIRRIVLTSAAVAVASIATTPAWAQLSWPKFGRTEEPADPFQSRPGMTPPASNVPGTPTEPRAAERPVVSRETYVAQRDRTAERPNYRDGSAFNDRGQTGSNNVRPAQYTLPAERNAGPREAAPDRPDPLLAAQAMARVGPEVILLGDVVGPVNQQLAARLRDGVIGPADIERERELLMRRAITNLIDQKLVLTVARRDIPAEALPKIEQSINEQFDKTQLKNLLEQTGAKTTQELAEMLKQSGSSLARQRKLYFERSVMQEWIRREVDFNPEVTHDDMLMYYREHTDEFAIKGQARWEELAVRFEEFPTKADAWRAIAEMGNRVLSRQASFAQVAREQSQGATASAGGARDWTSRGSLAAKEMDAALFSLPVGQMSRILEGPTGFHIIRVVERQDDSMRPFVEAQVEIRDTIRKQKTDRGIQGYLAELRANTPVWTIFDGPPQELAEVREGGPLR
jgi:parvulin-like peptidyl-prolyl isomerase